MELSLQALPWLPAAPEDFGARCRGTATSTDPIGPQLQALAQFRTSSIQAVSLGRAIAKAIVAGHDLTPLTPFRLGVLASTTFDLLTDEFAPAAARHGVALTVVSGPYDQVMQQALDPTSLINSARLDAVLVSVDHRWMNLERPALGAAASRIDAAMDQLTAVVEGLRDHGGAPVILQTLPMPALPLFGSFDRRTPGTVRHMVDEANRRIAALAEQSGGYLLDAAALAERAGLDAWFDPVQWAAHKIAFAGRWNAAYGDMLGRLLGAIRGKARKCLVLDLDNTCWGGVIGDDGLEGIKIGQGSATGEAFLAVQQMALDLYGRGVILAVSSKNDDANARLPFREHADMLLKESHLAVFQANWNDKASNLEAIAKTLNIGLDALVFLDDNPAERAQMRAALPMVAVPELPNDPAWYPWMLASAGYFEAVTFSEEDRLRAASYAADASRAEVMTKTRDLGEYLSSLEMVLENKPFDAEGRQRVVQLINKSNQFNLTTRRYTEAEIAAAQADETVFTLQTRLMDRFGDLGMIGVVIGRPAEHLSAPAWELDTWLMSCRVLGRKVEPGMLDAVVEAARAKGVKWLIGVYKPTPKNGMVAGHYDGLGFTPYAEDTTGVRRLVLDVDAYQTPPLPFRGAATLATLTRIYGT
jgi:FkbH-like protein